jgi:hypothetical protein
MQSTLIRCVQTRQYVRVVLMPVSEDSCSNYRAIICPQCMKIHCVRQKELACRLAE